LCCVLGGLTSRTRFTVAVAVAALPLLALLAYSAADRYGDDRSRAERRAVTRATLYAALLEEAGVTARPPTTAELEHVLELSPLPPGDAIAVLEDGEEVARVGDPAANFPVTAPRPGNFSATGTDGVERVWGAQPVAGGPLTVTFGLPGDAVYGEAQAALLRDVLLATLALLLVAAVAYLAGGRLTAPIRRMAATAGAGGTNELRAIEAELTRRADRIQALQAIDRALLDANTPEELARATLGRLRRLVGADRAQVVVFQNGRGEHMLAEDGAAGESGDRLDVPLVTEDGSIGEVRIGFDAPGAASDEAATLAREVARQLAVALRHAGLYAELQAILDGAMDVVVVFDDDRRFVSVNEAATRFYGRSREELLNARLDDFIGSERAEADWESFLTPERIAQGMVEDVWDGMQDGQRRVLEVRTRPEFLPGRHLFVLRDVSERVKLEDRLRQAQKMEAVGQLAGGVAHDFNNLLTVIGGYGEIARRRIGAGPGANELAEVERATQRATQLTQQLLAFSRQQVLEPVVLDLNEVASSLVPMLRRLIGEDVEIAMLAATDLPPVVADRTQIEQVIVNLAVNARDAMPTGGTLTIETRAVHLEEPFACLTVTDTGIGMDAETLEHVFEPFFTTKDVGRGTGLGLATVHGIVTQSGGRIHVYSEPGLGTSLKVYLPVGKATGPRAPESPASGDADLSGSETVLLCEDEDGVRHLIEVLLTARGYTVLAAADPRAALDLAAEREGPIDLLVTDVVMPGMSGPELVRRLDTLRPGLRTLFVSGYTAEALRGRTTLPVGSAFLEKPFDEQSLLRAVRTLLDQHAPTSG
jgi:two-component system, cell cycle sensor histidine kinase and response regulator CckA